MPAAATIIAAAAESLYILLARYHVNTGFRASKQGWGPYPRQKCDSSPPTNAPHASQTSCKSSCIGDAPATQARITSPTPHACFMMSEPDATAPSSVSWGKRLKDATPRATNRRNAALCRCNAMASGSASVPSSSVVLFFSFFLGCQSMSLMYAKLSFYSGGRGSIMLVPADTSFQESADESCQLRRQSHKLRDN